MSQSTLLESNNYRIHLINIDSRFRKSKLEPPTDFLYHFAHPYKNVLKVRVASVEIPITSYNFSKVKQNTMFRIDIQDYTGAIHNITVAIDDGDYTPQTLISAIQSQFELIRNKYGIFLRITYNPITKRTTIVSDGSSGPGSIAPTFQPNTFSITFGMVGLEQRTYDFGLGYNLGFVSHFYTVPPQSDGTYSITSESLINTITDTYYLLCIDDLYTVEHKTADSYIQCLAKILIKRNSPNTDTNPIIFDDGYTVLSNSIVFPRPTDLKQAQIRLLDCYGAPVDLQHFNMSISLEITEIMNVKLYDSYRNSIWSGAEPVVMTHSSGSSAAIAFPGRGFN
jgi:hypothetical protein